MSSTDPGEAFAAAAAALNEVTRLEEVRYDSSPESWEQLLAGLATVVTSAGRLADCVADHLSAAGEESELGPATAANGQHDEVLAAAEESVQQVSRQLTEVSRLVAVSRDQVALLRTKQDSTTEDSA